MKVLKRAPSIRAQKAVNIILANPRKSKGQALREAGYSESVARHPADVFSQEPVVEIVDGVLQKLKAERVAILNEMLEKRKGANYGTLAMALGIINKDIELLEGRPTDIHAHALTEEQKARLDRLFKLNS